MLQLVTIDEAREQIRTDFDSNGGADDAWLSIAIPAASQAVASWLKDRWRLYEIDVDTAGNPVLNSDGVPVPAEDSYGQPIVAAAVRLAVLVELASQYRFREGGGQENVVSADAGYGYVLNKASTALLAPLRKPTLA